MFYLNMCYMKILVLMIRRRRSDKKNENNFD